MDVTTIKVISGLLVSLVLPFLAEPLNKLWKLDGPKALALAAILAGILSFVALYVTGAITNTQLQNLTMENYLALFTAVYGVSQTEFQLLKNQLGWNSANTNTNDPVG